MNDTPPSVPRSNNTNILLIIFDIIIIHEIKTVIQFCPSKKEENEKKGLHSAGTGSFPNTITLFTCSSTTRKLLLKVFSKDTVL